MEVVAVAGKKRCEIVERPDPKVRDGYCLVRNLAVPMCTEFHMYENGSTGDVFGHEAAGEVVEAPPAGRVKKGDRVVVMPQFPCGRCALCIAGDYIHCEHCEDPLQVCGSESGVTTYAQFCIKRDWLLIPVPEDVSVEHAAMACCGLGPSFGAMQRMRVSGVDTILVVGLGPVGLGAVINATYRGARVLGVEPSGYRADLARELGAEAVVDPRDPGALRKVKDLTGGRGADGSVDCTAVPAAQKFAIEATRRRGRVSFVGWGGHVEVDNMVPPGLDLMGIWHWNLRDTALMIQTIRANRAKLDRLITHRLPMSKAGEAFELQCRRECGKIVLDPWK